MSKPVILVVDDDVQVLQAVRRDMRGEYHENYQLLAASSGQDAVETTKKLKTRGDELAMIISDQRMPGMLGVEVLTSCCEIYPHAKRVLLTAYSDIEAAVRGINEAHLDHYLSKPWDPPEEQLFPVVNDLLDAWQAEREPELSGLRLVGYELSPRSHTIKQFLSGNLVPYRWRDAIHDADARALLEAGAIGDGDLPALILEDGEILRNPDVRAVAGKLGLNVEATRDLYDLVIVGSGPAGLGAAVYGASEGLHTLLLDRLGPGGQAGTSSRIENYLGFPKGVSGADLTRRAVAQAQRLGAEVLAPVAVDGLWLVGGYKRLTVDDGPELFARAVLVATGMTYREHEARGTADLIGAGVYYGAATTEARAFTGRRVCVVGGGNSAGQGAMYLSRFASEVQVVIRRDGLEATMSQYLIEQLAQTPNIRLRPRTVVTAVDGDEHLERVTFRCLEDDTTAVEDVDGLFVFIGTRPHSDWLPSAVLRNAGGFVLTGRDVARAEGFRRIWKEPREPTTFETSVPGVFAAGDVRAGAMNRVASAVGEGAMAVRLVHEYLAST